MNSLMGKWSEQAENMRIFHMQELKDTGYEWKKLLQDHLKEGNDRKILDVGCGTGFFALLLAQDGWKVTAIDSSEAMLDEGKKAAEELGLSDRIMFLMKDAHSTNFPEHSFDAVVSRNASWLFTDPEKAYREWKRILKVDGMMLNIDANWMKPLWNAETFQEFKKDEAELIKRYGDFKDYYHDKEMMNALKKFPLSSVNRPGWDEKMLQEIGFTEIRIHFLSKNKYLDSFQAKRCRTIPIFLIQAKSI